MIDSKPLDGLLVVSIEQAVAAPLCTSRLADAGARVIKIERSEGETARHYDTAVNGTSAYFAWLNRGKQSAIMNLKSEKDILTVKSMLSKADIFVQNLSPGATDRLGLSSQYLRQTNPALIKLDIVGYGQDTSYADMRAYDMLVQSESGLCAVTGTDSDPCKVGVSVADIATGMTAHAAILEALLERSITKRGKSIEISMFDCLADWMNVPLLHFEHMGKQTLRYGLAHAAIYPYRPFSCRGGEIVIAIQNADEWSRLCQIVLKRSELETDSRFSSNQLRVENRVALDSILEPLFSTMPLDKVSDRVKKAKLASAKVRDVEGLCNHPALRRIEAKTNGQSFTLAAPPLHIRSKAKSVPMIGEHTHLVQEEFG